MEEIKLNITETKMSIEDSVEAINAAKDNNTYTFATEADLNREWTSNFVVKLEAPQITSDVKSARSTDMVFILDVSGSMSLKNKLNDLKKVSKEIISKFEGNVNLGMIAFSGDIVKEFAITAMNASGKSRATAFIDSLAAGGSTYLLSSMTKAQNWLLNSKSDSKCIIVQTDGDIFDCNKTNEYGNIKSNCIKNEILIQSIALDNDMGFENYKFMGEYLCTRGGVVNAGTGNKDEIGPMLKKVFEKMDKLVVKNCKLCFKFAPQPNSSYKERIVRVINTKTDTDITDKISGNKVELGSFTAGQVVDFVVEIQHRPQVAKTFATGKGKGYSRQSVCIINLEYQDITGKTVITSSKPAIKTVYSEKTLCVSQSSDCSESDRTAIVACAEVLRNAMNNKASNSSGAVKQTAERNAIEANKIIEEYGSEAKKQLCRQYSAAMAQHNERAKSFLVTGSDSDD